MKRGSRPSRHDWLGLVELSGLVVTEPVLDERYPEGFPPVDRSDQRWFRRQADRARLAGRELEAQVKKGADSPAPRQALRRFVDFVLESFLDHPGELWAKGGEVPDTCRKTVAALRQELRPSRVLLDQGGPALLVEIADPARPLARKDPAAGRWKVSPPARLERLLREVGKPLGLVTNGLEWQLIFCPRGLSTGSIAWTTRLLYEEPSSLAALRTLLGPDLLRPAKGRPGLEALCRRSIDRQVEVADQLGLQVRQALELFLQEIDRADRRVHGRLLAGMSDERVYEMLMVVIMRLLFLLYAEERNLLPHGDLLYDQSYGVSHLWQQLQERRERLEREWDAWDRLLAAFRLVHQGCRHPDLSLKAYGGLLFDPARYPALESPDCRISNQAIHQVLDQLLYARPRKGGARQRVGYWSLDVEEIGYLYEGLLDHRAAQAGADPIVKLRGAGEAALPLNELEKRSGDDLIEFVVQQTGGRSGPRERERLTESMQAGGSEEDLRQLARFPEELAHRARRYAPLIQCAELVPAGWRYLTLGESRRETGSQYTPQSLTAPVVEATLEPLVYRCRAGKPGDYVLQAGERVLKSPRQLLALKICDMAMGSGAFLVQAIRYLGERLVEAWDKAQLEAGEETRLTLPFAEPAASPSREFLLPFDNRDELLLWARRQVASCCVHGVDINPLAVEMARLSLWLITLGKDVPFSFLDHALKCGDSLVGASRRQLEGWSLSELEQDRPLLPLSFEAIDAALQQASVARREVEALPVLEARDAETKAALLQRGEGSTELLRLAGDLLVAPSLLEENKQKRRDLRAGLLKELAEAVESGDIDGLRTRRRVLLEGHRPFHWFVEFPEVFEQGGFDAVVGNPPFLGGQRISGVLGSLYREYLVDVIAGGKKGSADLVSYFFLRAAGLLQTEGCLGLLATNTIAQGDTREVGLDQIVSAGLSLYNAVKSRPWPGDASVEVSVVHLSRGRWSGPKKLDGEQVDRISTTLDAGPGGKPLRLAANRDLSFQGSTVLGMGFVLSVEEARELIEKDPRNRDVLEPYLNGQDLNSHPEQQPSRWVINFRDWSLVEAEHYPDLIARVRHTVKPERDRNKRNTYRLKWWHFAEKRPALYGSIAAFNRVLACSQTSAHWVPAFLPKNIVYSHTVVVFALSNWSQYAVMQSSIHEAWKLQRGPTLRNDPRYTPSDCFETFPFFQPDPRSLIPELERIGETYHERRRQMMLERQVGLTALYNLFHNPACQDADLVELRGLHVEMDLAVAAAYGWSDLRLGHDFHENDRGQTRFTVSPEARVKILRLLLDLNRQRFEAEVAQGLHAKRSKAKQRKGKPPAIQPQADAPARPRQPKFWDEE